MNKVFYFVAAITFFLCSCVDEASKCRVQVRETVDSLNALCPCSVGKFSVDKYEFDHDTLSLWVSVDGTEFPLPIFKAVYDKEHIDANFLNYISILKSCKNYRDFRHDLNVIGATIKIEFSDKDSDYSFITVMTNNEIKDYSKRKVDNLIRSRIRLKLKLVGESIRCPQDDGNGFIMQSVYINGDYVCFEYLIDENRYSVEAISQNKESVKKEIINSFQSSGIDMYGDFISIKGSHYGVEYKYIGNSSGEETEVYIGYDELPEIDKVQEYLFKNSNNNFF